MIFSIRSKLSRFIEPKIRVKSIHGFNEVENPVSVWKPVISISSLLRSSPCSIIQFVNFFLLTLPDRGSINNSLYALFFKETEINFPLILILFNSFKTSYSLTINEFLGNTGSSVK